MIVVVMIVVVVAIAMVVVVPMSFMNLPASLVVVVVGMAPVGAGIWWPLPSAGDPYVAGAVRVPITIGPHESLCRHRRPDLIAYRRRWSPDIDLNLAVCRNCQSRCGEDTA
jgi:hypothetical protein